MPCLAEMRAIEENIPLTCRVEMVDRKVIHFPIEPQSTLEDLTKHIITKTDYSLSEPFSTGTVETKQKSIDFWAPPTKLCAICVIGWGIWENSNGGSFPLRQDMKVCDVMAAWESSGASFPNSSGSPDTIVVESPTGRKVEES